MLRMHTQFISEKYCNLIYKELWVTNYNCIKIQIIPTANFRAIFFVLLKMWKIYSTYKFDKFENELHITTNKISNV